MIIIDFNIVLMIIIMSYLLHINTRKKGYKQSTLHQTPSNH